MEKLKSINTIEATPEGKVKVTKTFDAPPTPEPEILEINPIENEKEILSLEKTKLANEESMARNNEEMEAVIADYQSKIDELVEYRSYYPNPSK